MKRSRFRNGMLASILATAVVVSLAGPMAPALAASTLDCTRPAGTAPTPEEQTRPNAATKAAVTSGGAALHAFAGIAIPQAVVNDPITGNAIIAYYTPGDYPQPAVAEVTANGTVVSQAVLKDGDGTDSLALYRVGNEDDSANSLTIALDSKGYVHVAGNMRSYRPAGYWRSADPHTVGSMLYKSQMPGLVYNAGGISLFATGAERVSSNPQLFQAANGELYFGFNHYEPGKGNFYLLHYDADTHEWDNPSGGHDTTYGFVDQNKPLLDGYSDDVSPYVQPIVTGPDGWYWLTWSWRDDKANADTQSRISVMKTQDFTTWYSASGKALPSSIAYSWVDKDSKVPADFVVGSTMPRNGAGFVNNQNFLGFSSAGTPVMVYFSATRGRTLLWVDKLGDLNTWISATPVPMRGFYDAAGALNADTLSIAGPPRAVAGSSDMIVQYTCNGVALQARVGVGPMNTYATLVSYDYERTGALPADALIPSPGSAGNAVTPRVAISPSFSAGDTTRVWAITWDAGPIEYKGVKPSRPFPADGSPITLYSYTPSS